MTDRDPHLDGAPQADDDTRTDIEQIVDARKDAVERGEGSDGDEPAPMTAPGMFTGNAGTGGVVKNQDRDAQ